MSNAANIDIRVGDMFASGAQTLVNTVNTEGVMGKGIALEFKRRFPNMYDDYAWRCARREVRLGEPYLYRGLYEPWILNFPTKLHWRSHSRLADIEAGLRYLRDRYNEWGVTSMAVPPLGCGHGGLEWRVVGRVLYQAFREFEIPILLYAPYGTPEEQLTVKFLANADPQLAMDSGPVRIPPAWVAIVVIVAALEQQQPYRWRVGRTAFQKIAYFATEAGLPTHLDFIKSSYGPFASDLNRMKAVLINNGLLAEEPLGRMVEVKPGPALDHAREAYTQALSEWASIVARVTDLFLRMDTRQAEVAATVHFAATRLIENRGPTELDVMNAVKDWKARRRPVLTDEEIAVAIRNLLLHGWIDVEPSRALPLPLDLRLTDEADLSAA
ncbi:MAG: macro domain-containing protein [Gaiellaceae bacterium]|jgi:O-acetyl-ADP-ribose deacetylase (regulator of RNase III)/uncharacterized protein YwgA